MYVTESQYTSEVLLNEQLLYTLYAIGHAKLPKQADNSDHFSNNNDSTQQPAAVAAVAAAAVEHEQAAHTALQAAIATLINDSDGTTVDDACTWSQQQLIDTCTMLCNYVTQGLTRVGAAGRKGAVLHWSTDDAVDDWEDLA
jgi:uncharacterized protein YgfB (UPF0149 family)